MEEFSTTSTTLFFLYLMCDLWLSWRWRGGQIHTFTKYKGTHMYYMYLCTMYLVRGT